MTAAATHTHGRAGEQASLGQFSWPLFEAASQQNEATAGDGHAPPPPSLPSLGGVGVTGVQACLCGRGGVAVMGARRQVEGLCAPPEVLQGLQEGTTCPLLLERRGALLLHLCDFGKGDRLGLEASLAGPAGAASALRRALGDRQLLGELLHGRGHKVSWQDVEAGRLHGHLTHSSHRWKLESKWV